MISFKPKEYQVDGIAFLKIARYAILGDQMGLGKTFQAIRAASELGLPTLVVCPAFLMANWEREIEKFSDDPSKFYVTSYSRLKNSRLLFEKAKIVIADEGQYLKNPQAKRTEMFHNYIEWERPDYLWLLSGTIIKNSVDEWFSPLALMSYCPVDNGKRITDNFTYWSFKKYFMKSYKITVGSRVIQKFEGIKNELRLLSYFEGKYLRRKASQVLDLPPITRIQVPPSKAVESKDLKKAWDDYQNGERAEYISTAKMDSAIAKTKLTIEYAIDVLDNSGSVIIFSDHVSPVKIIRDRFRGLNRKVEIITGETPSNARQKIVDDFNNGTIDVLVATIGAASTGYTLTRSNHIVFNDISYVPSDNMQAEKRIHRIGQDNKCFIHYILGGDIDEMIVKNIRNKVKILEKTL